MSCTENESGSFVVFFLPAVVGCLTILLARRWSSSQVSNTSSNAISRRRKIIKDPLAKRATLPTITCKMMPPGPKKATGVNKKVTLPVAEEEMNGGKRVGRTTRPPSSTPLVSISDVKLNDGPLHPKHVPFPYIPQDGTLLFEAMTFMFVLIATGLQFLNLYRTAWWLPHSYTNQAMNFYLIDIHLVTFIVTLISRRFVLCAIQEALKGFLAPKLLPHVLSATRLLLMGILFAILMFCTYVMLFKHPLVKIFFLLYPAVIYLFLFGFTPGPFMELNHSDTPPLHCCSSDPEQIRAEVETLRQDFNMRIKKMIFNSVIEAYYSSFMPCCFAQLFHHYDVYAASQQVAFVWCGVWCRYSSQLLPAPAADTAHRAVAHLATWHKHDQHHEECEEWSPTRLYRGGAVVSHKGAVWSAAPHALAVAATPADPGHNRFYNIFYNPSTLLCCNVCTQLALIVVQLCLLFSSLPWHNFLSIVILLFINYYTLFKMIRDYLIAFKVYKAELLIQDKNNIALAAN